MTRLMFLPVAFLPRAATVFVVSIGSLGVAPSSIVRGAEPEATTPPRVIQFAAAEESPAWFPEPADVDITIRPPVQLGGTAEPVKVSAREHALIPLPPAAWTGLTGLTVLALPVCRRTLHRIIR